MTQKRRMHKWIETLEDRKYLAAPVLDAISNVTVPTGKTLQIPLTASDADGDALSYSVTRSGSLTTYVRPSSNTWVRFNVQGFGMMEFQLFDDTAPLTVRSIKGLVDSGFYNGLTFHRILEDFVIQGGDPAGNGSGGPEWRFDDEFDPNSFFTGNGQLAMANSGKDTNGSQFFVTVKDPTNGPPRFLDGNHAIFGQLVRGFDVFNAVRSVPVGNGGTPLSPVVITSAETYVNKTDGVLQVKPTANSGGSVTVRVSDGTTQVSRTFTVSGVADTSNAPPMLLPV
ncbi:MAG TPA: peptidylprolyl isomerase, partial [Tepidisphaeraceae bacterium]|nr:peptidylprolyl isomerase [Tepidisphaeraceae bacterium]